MTLAVGKTAGDLKTASASSAFTKVPAIKSGQRNKCAQGERNKCGHNGAQVSHTSAAGDGAGTATGTRHIATNSERLNGKTVVLSTC